MLFLIWYRKPKITELDEILCQFVDQLSEEKRQIFMSLSDCKVDENEEEKTELGIWRTNNFALGKNPQMRKNRCRLSLSLLLPNPR